MANKETYSISNTNTYDLISFMKVLNTEDVDSTLQFIFMEFYNNYLSSNDLTNEFEEIRSEYPEYEAPLE